MITYALDEKSHKPLYEQLMEQLTADIRSGVLMGGTKLPAKRPWARHLGISCITVERAYNELVSQGYLQSRARSGYFVSKISLPQKIKVSPAKSPRTVPDTPCPTLPRDLSSNRSDPAHFPFSVWSKLMRETLSRKQKALLQPSPANGVPELRQALAEHLSSFRGMTVDPGRIVVGAGGEYLYGLLSQLLPGDTAFGIENPGYPKIAQVYGSLGRKCTPVSLDRDGVSPGALATSGANVLLTSPTHHFPTGICMPAARRYELLAWANEAENRWIVEDDYDSEFRFSGKPLPTLQSIDSTGRVIYLNTFSKTLAPTMRMGYMVLPEALSERFAEKLSFLNCSVPNFEQYTLAAFLSQGYFERHINRMRLFYARLRVTVMDRIAVILPAGTYSIEENASGLHFVLHFHTNFSAKKLGERFAAAGIRMKTLGDFNWAGEKRNKAESGDTSFVLSYSALDPEILTDALLAMKSALTAP